MYVTTGIYPEALAKSSFERDWKFIGCSSFVHVFAPVNFKIVQLLYFYIFNYRKHLKFFTFIDLVQRDVIISTSKLPVLTNTCFQDKGLKFSLQHIFSTKFFQTVFSNVKQSSACMRQCSESFFTEFSFSILKLPSFNPIYKTNQKFSSI